MSGYENRLVAFAVQRGETEACNIRKDANCFVAWYKKEKKSGSLMKYHFIAIEGNIGAGKTTLAHLLSKKLNARLVLEEFDENPFLPKFYENPKQYAFPLELFFMAERFKQLKDMLRTKDMFQSVTVSDYLFTKCCCLQK
jgi:Cdc6-like AAA superfamily ATPase